MRSRISVLCLVVVVLFVSAALMGADDVWAFQKGKKPGGGGKPSTIDVLQLVFHDNMTVGSARVVSDGMVVGGGGVTYTDRRIPDDGEACVTARFLQGGGGTFVHLDSGSNTGDLANNCNAQVSDPNSPYYDPNHVARTYVLEFSDACACNVLELGPAPCSMAIDPGPDGAPRISTSSLFKKNDKTATIDLMFRVLRDPDSEHPEPWTEAFVVSSNNPLNIGGSGDLRYLQSLGEEFRLNSLSTGNQCGAFPFWLSIDFIKVTAPQGGS